MAFAQWPSAAVARVGGAVVVVVEVVEGAVACSVVVGVGGGALACGMAAAIICFQWSLSCAMVMMSCRGRYAGTSINRLPSLLS